MGELSHQLFEVNGESGHTYRLRRRGNAGFDMDLLNDVRHYATWRGHVAVAGSVELRSEGDVGYIKLKPELSADEIREIHEAGLSAEAILH